MTAVALILTVVTLLLVLWLATQVIRLRGIVAAMPEDGGIYTGLQRLDADLSAAEAALAGMEPRLAAVEAQLPRAIQHTGVVAYDAFDDIAGNRSRSIALLNARGDGVVVSLLVSRDDTRWFTKLIRDGAGVEPLSPEEREAVRDALRR